MKGQLQLPGARSQVAPLHLTPLNRSLMESQPQRKFRLPATLMSLPSNDRLTISMCPLSVLDSIPLSMSPCSLGLMPRSHPVSLTPISCKHSCSRPTISSTLDAPKTTSLSGPTALISPMGSGSMCSSTAMLTSTESTLDIMPLIQIPTTLNQSATLISHSTMQALARRQTSRSKCMESGPSHSWPPKQPSSMPILTAHENLQSTGNLLWVNSQHSLTP